MLASKIKAVSVHYCPLPLDSRVDFFIFNNSPPFEKCISPGAFLRINTVIRKDFSGAQNCLVKYPVQTGIDVKPCAVYGVLYLYPH